MKMKKKIKYIISYDDREPDYGLLAIANNLDLEFKRKRLKLGDYIYKNLMIERKEINDLCGSIMDGRLKSQIERMKESGKDCWIFIINPLNLKTSEINKNCILGAIISAIYKHGMKVMWCQDDDEFLWCLQNLVEKYEKTLIEETSKK